MDLSGLERLHLFQKCCSFGGKWDSWIYHHVCKKSVDVTWAREIQGLSPLLTGSFLGVYQHVWSYEQRAILLGPFLSKQRRFGDLTPGIFHFFFLFGDIFAFLKKFFEHIMQYSRYSNSRSPVRFYYNDLNYFGGYLVYIISFHLSLFLMLRLSGWLLCPFGKLPLILDSCCFLEQNKMRYLKAVLYCSLQTWICFYEETLQWETLFGNHGLTVYIGINYDLSLEKYFIKR